MNFKVFDIKRFLFFFYFIVNITVYAQVKVGDNPAIIDSNSILELESEDKVLVITKMTTPIMNSITPLQGALVYNTTTDCVYTYNGNSWISLCDGSATSTSGISVTTAPTPPVNNNTGDFWVNSSTNNSVSVWDGTIWIPVDNNPRTNSGVPTSITAPSPSAGEIYVDETTGFIYAYDGTTWVNSEVTISANNGVFLDTVTNTLELGGLLIKPTIIETSASNTLAITGLQELQNTENLQNGDLTTNDIVTVDKTTGTLRRTSFSNAFREEVAIITANSGQLQFNPTLLISDSKKVNVYRNGVRIDFTVVNNTTIEVEPEAICYAGDEIRIVQFY